MAEIFIPEEEEVPGFLDVNQIDNLIVGINRAGAGGRQALEEFKEMLGLVPEGSSVAETIRLKKEMEVLGRATRKAGSATGAGVVQFAGEALPLFLAPLGATVPRALAIGAGTGAGFFQEDVDESRYDDMLFGAGAGGLFRGGINAASRSVARRGAKADAEDTIQALKAEMVGPPSPRGAEVVGPMIPESPAAQQMRARGLTADDFQNAGQDALRQTRGAVEFPAPPKAAGRNPRQAGAIRKAQVEARNAQRKIEAGLIKAKTRAKTLTQKIEDIKGKFGKSIEGRKTAPKSTTLEKLYDQLSKAKRDQMGATILAKSIAARRAHYDKLAGPPQRLALPAPERQLALPAPAKKATTKTKTNKATAMSNLIQKVRDSGTKKDMVAMLKRVDPEAKVNSRSTKSDLSMALKKAQGNLGTKQGGFLNTDVQGLASGAVLGGAIGGIAGAQAGGDAESALLGAVAGALSGGALGRGASRKAAKHVTHKERAAMREASKNNQKFISELSRNAKAKDFTGTAISEAWSGAKGVLDHFMGAMMTRLEVVAPRIATALKETEFAQHYRSGQWLNAGDKIFDTIGRANLTDSQARTFKKLLNNSTENARRYLASIGKTDAADALREMQALLNSVGEYLGEVGLGNSLRKNYFPRMVKDTGVFENIEEVDTYLKMLAKKKGIQLTDFEKETAITQVINGALHRKEGGKFARASANLQKRTVKVDDGNVDAYADPKEAFNDYIESVTNQVERRRFFQGQGVKVDDLGPNSENLDAVAARLKEMLKGGDLTEDQVEEVTRLIANRFGPGEQAPHRAVQDFKNLTYAGLLGNPMSAATQFGDMALSAYRNGIANTVAAATANILGKGKLQGIDKETLLGVRNAATDFASRTSTRDLLNWSLKWGGFQAVDRLGKNTFIQASLMKNKQLSKDSFVTKWKGIFDPDAAPGGPTPRTEKLFNDVQNFKAIDDANREDIGFMLWNELSDVQPIAISALPEAYLKNPNGRMAYMLQSFTLKMFDLMRRDIVTKLADPATRKQGVKNAVNLSSLFVGMNGGVEAAKSFLTGKDVVPSEIVVNNYLKLLGMNKFMVGQISREGLGDALLKTAAPPMALPNALLDPAKALEMTPPAGRIVSPFIGE